MAENVPPEKVLATAKSGAVMGKTNRNLTVDLIVPDMIVPDLTNCGIIDIGYFIKAKILLAGCNDDMDDEAEIFLGLVPLNGFTQDYKHPMAHSLPDGPIPDPNQPLSYNPVNMEPTNTPYTSKSQMSLASYNYPPQNVPYPSQNMPYPSQNMPYPSNMPGKAPFSDYQIGFKGLNDTPYPTSMPNISPPYPSDIPPSTGHGLHITMPTVTPMSPEPSAPPPSS